MFFLILNRYKPVLYYHSIFAMPETIKYTGLNELSYAHWPYTL